MRPVSLVVPFIAVLGLAATAFADDGPNLPRYQVAGAGENVVLVDTFTGRSWELDLVLADRRLEALVESGSLEELRRYWRPLRFLDERTTGPVLRETPP